MPSEKSERTAQRRRERNRPRRSEVKTAVTKTRRLIQAGDLSAAEEAARSASAILDRTAQKGAIHQNNAARRKGRLARMLNKASQQAAGRS